MKLSTVILTLTIATLITVADQAIANENTEVKAASWQTKRFKQLDADKNGSLSPTEFQAQTSAWMKKSGLTSQQQIEKSKINLTTGM